MDGFKEEKSIMCKDVQVIMIMFWTALVVKVYRPYTMCSVALILYVLFMSASRGGCACAVCDLRPSILCMLYKFITTQGDREFQCCSLSCLWPVSKIPPRNIIF